jgi:hypothetical protein
MFVRVALTAQNIPSKPCVYPNLRSLIIRLLPLLSLASLWSSFSRLNDSFWLLLTNFQSLFDLFFNFLLKIFIRLSLHAITFVKVHFGTGLLHVDLTSKHFKVNSDIHWVFQLLSHIERLNSVLNSFNLWFGRWTLFVCLNFLLMVLN